MNSTKGIPIKQYWLILKGYLIPQRFRMTVLAIFLLLQICLNLVNPQIIRTFIDGLMEGVPQDILINSGILFFLVAFFSQVLSISTTYFGEQVAWTATNEMRLDLLLHCLKLDASFHKDHTSGELLERIDGDVNTLSNFFSRFMILFIGNILLILGVIILLMIEDWRIGIGISLISLLSLLIMIKVRVIAIPYWKKVREISADFAGFLTEKLTSSEDILANGASGFVMNKFDQIMQRWYPVRTKAMMGTNLLWSTNIITSALGTMVAFALGGYFWQQEAITIGTVYLIFHYTAMIQHPLSQLRNQIEDLQKAEASIERIQELFDTQPKLIDGQQNNLPTGPLSSTFVGVSFGYDGIGKNHEIALNQVTFSLAGGRVLGLLGRTGSGKTTIAKLLMRIHDPNLGEVQLGETNIKKLSITALRNRVGMVTQDVQLFEATIRDNLTLFNHTIKDTQILTALEDLGMLSWLSDQPNGLDFQLKAGGKNLSAGQAQLLAFARVFLSNPSLVILDEASSRLDPVTERLTEQAVDKLLYQRTGIIIAHRLGTVQRADDILILENGSVLEYGDRVKLSQDPTSHFYRLLETGLEEVLV